MEMHARKKIEWIVEESVLPQIIRAIDDLGATGYSVVRHVSGKGHHGERHGAGVSGVFDNAMIVVITTAETAERLLEETKSLLRDRVGIVYLSDVEVLRAEHF